MKTNKQTERIARYKLGADMERSRKQMKLKFRHARRMERHARKRKAW